jgi:hypothetical protein
VDVTGVGAICFFKTPRIPAPPPAPLPQDALAARNNALQKRAGAFGQAQTIIGGALGPQENKTPAKTLLGA